MLLRALKHFNLEAIPKALLNWLRWEMTNVLDEVKEISYRGRVVGPSVRHSV